jgi:hypothetical protein
MPKTAYPYFPKIIKNSIMKKLLLLISIITLFGQKVKACRCITPFSPFCKAIERVTDNDIVVRVIVEERIKNSAKLRILNLYKGNETQTTILAWGSDGVNCLYGVGNVGKTYIMILSRIKVAYQTTLDEKTGDYQTLSCAVSKVLVENGKIIGHITEETMQTMDDIDPKRLPFCPNFKTDLDLLENIVIAPNPTNNMLHFKNLTTEVSIEIFDLLGRLIQQTTIVPSQNFLNVADLASGLYIVRFRKSSSVHTVKFGHLSYCPQSS